MSNQISFYYLWATFTNNLKQKETFNSHSNAVFREIFFFIDKKVISFDIWTFESKHFLNNFNMYAKIQWHNFWKIYFYLMTKNSPKRKFLEVILKNTWNESTITKRQTLKHSMTKVSFGHFGSKCPHFFGYWSLTNILQKRTLSCDGMFFFRKKMAIEKIPKKGLLLQM